MEFARPVGSHAEPVFRLTAALCKGCSLWHSWPCIHGTLLGICERVFLVWSDEGCWSRIAWCDTDFTSFVGHTQKYISRDEANFKGLKKTLPTMLKCITEYAQLSRRNTKQLMITALDRCCDSIFNATIWAKTLVLQKLDMLCLHAFNLQNIKTQNVQNNIVHIIPKTIWIRTRAYWFFYIFCLHLPNSQNVQLQPKEELQSCFKRIIKLYK